MHVKTLHWIKKKKLFVRYKKQKEKNKLKTDSESCRLLELMSPYLRTNVINDYRYFKGLLDQFLKLDYNFKKIKSWDRSIINLEELDIKAPFINIRLHAELKCISHILETFNLEKQFIFTEPPLIFLVGCSKLMCAMCNCYEFFIEMEYNVVFFSSGYHRTAYEDYYFPHELNPDVSSETVIVFKL